MPCPTPPRMHQKRRLPRIPPTLVISMTPRSWRPRLWSPTTTGGNWGPLEFCQQDTFRHTHFGSVYAGRLLEPTEAYTPPPCGQVGRRLQSCLWRRMGGGAHGRNRCDAWGKARGVREVPTRRIPHEVRPDAAAKMVCLLLFATPLGAPWTCHFRG